MIQEIFASMPVKVIGLAVILISFVVLLKNPNITLMDAMRKKSELKKDSKK